MSIARRKRRLGRAGYPELGDLHQTHFWAGQPDIAVPSISTDDLGDTAADPLHFDRPQTLTTKIEITDDAAPVTGLIWEFGDSGRASALWIDDTIMVLFAGSGTVAAESVLVSWDYGSRFPTGLIGTVVAGIVPETGQARLYFNGIERKRGEATSGSLGGGWTIPGEDGSFASAMSSTLPGDVTQTGAPVGFRAIRGLSYFRGQYPRQMSEAT